MENNLVFTKYGKIQALSSPQDIKQFEDVEFEVYEKLDGGNCQIRRFESGVIGGSRANFLTGKNLERVNWFGKFNRWLRNNVSLFQLPERVVVFGEWLGNHTIEYNPQFQDEFFFLDLFDVTSDSFVEYGQAKRYLESLGINDINYLPLLTKGKLDPSLIEEILYKKSDYYDGPKEGVVLKAYKDGSRFKIYHPEFTEKRVLENGSIDYLTPVRFTKAIFRLREFSGGKKIEISDLIEDVVMDIAQEENVDLPNAKVVKRFWAYHSQGRLHRAKDYLVN